MNLLHLVGNNLETIYGLALRARRLFGKQRCSTFGDSPTESGASIEHIFVINLDREPKRWQRILDELDHVLDSAGVALSRRATRVSAVDAREHDDQPWGGLVDTTYTLGEQLFVDPHPLASADRLDLDERIYMSPQEIAVACSHIDVWKRIASGQHAYAMVLEDDAWFRPNFARVVDQAWTELPAAADKNASFDVLYVSYHEVDYGAEKVQVSPLLFSPFRGLWCLSGYVLSRSGAMNLLALLPVRGPVDLWLNHQFRRLKVYGTASAVIEQRLDERSNNSYSALPVLSRVGVMNSETPGLFRGRLLVGPVFAFGANKSGLSSLAMALSMLGYRCCSDIDRLPRSELQRLIKRDPDRIFDAYVNVGSLSEYVETLADLYPEGRLILTTDKLEDLEASEPTFGTRNNYVDDASRSSIPESNGWMGKWGARVLVLHKGAPRIWKILCEFLRCIPPASSYPYVEELGQRRLNRSTADESGEKVSPDRKLQFDDSPWVAVSSTFWQGVPSSISPDASYVVEAEPFEVSDDFSELNPLLWYLRDDTFTGNLALFRPANFIMSGSAPARIILREEDLGVRKYSSAALTSRVPFLYGRFEVVLRPPRVPGLVTGVFLHRDLPRQEIDIELVGKRSRHMLTNVYYNPGGNNAQFDYGYRGTPILIDLGFDATEDFHSYGIEWSPHQLRWYVDGLLVHQRANWNPTPIPHLPMRFHINLWPSRSSELAGRISSRKLPASCTLKSVKLQSSLMHDDSSDAKKK